MADKEAGNSFSIQKLYLKDLSFESPETPHVFSFEQWNPVIELNMNNTNRKINESVYEAILTITATVKNEEKVSFLVEVHQAGIFDISGFSEEDLKYILGSQCMNILFPYARESISDASVRGGFPPLILSPVNFDALYHQHLQQQPEQSEKEEETQH